MKLGRILILTALFVGLPHSVPFAESPQNQKTAWLQFTNKILGYSFEYPATWHMDPEASTSEYNFAVDDCNPPDITSCKGLGFKVQVVRQSVPSTQPLPGGWTKTPINVGRMPANKIVKIGSDSTLIEVDFLRNVHTYELTWGYYYPPEETLAAKQIYDHILSSFRFFEAQTPQPPSDYIGFKDIANWNLVYVDRGTHVTCSKINDKVQHVAFDMYTVGEADINTPYKNVIRELKRERWKLCYDSKSDSEETDRSRVVYKKNDKLIEVSRTFSLGSENKLQVVIQQ